jgi:N,N'-diacetyllegionaminate synthase
VLIGTHDLSKRVMVVAEIGNNHEGDLGLAERMIAAAAAAGADAVKFQTITPSRLVSVDQKERRAQLERFALPSEAWSRLAAAAAAQGVLFLSTPFDVDAVPLLDPLVPAFKIASGDNDFLPLLRAVAATGKPILISRGMADRDGIVAALDCLVAGGAREIVVLHCVSCYPTAQQDANLSALRDLAQLTSWVGYSDHTLGRDAAVLSVALGARVIEKHFTLDKAQSDFRDHQLSADPAEFDSLVAGIRAAETLLGTGGLHMHPCEAPTASAARRSLAASRDLQAGEILRPQDLTWLRPGTGLRDLAAVEGVALTRGLAAGELLTPDHLDTHIR